MEAVLDNPYVTWIITGVVGALCGAVVFFLKRSLDKAEKRLERQETHTRELEEKLNKTISDMPFLYMNHYHSVNISHTHSIGSHSHALDQHTHGINHYHALGSHRHDLSAHTHGLVPHTHRFLHWHHATVSLNVPGLDVQIPSHTHDVSIPSHSHTLNIPSHQHGIEYGIFKGPSAEAYVVEVDGTAIPASVFSEQGIGDIAPYLKTDGRGKILRGTFHTLAVRPTASEDNPNGLCRIRASWSAQVFISSLTGKQY